MAYYADPASRSTAERDFGGVARGSCLLVAEPDDASACERLVSELARRELGCTVRGAGYSQSGQSVAADSVTVSTRRLDRISRVDSATRSITAGAGSTLRRILSSLHGSGLIPPALPLNLDMSIGGLLSAGGIGPASHRHGPVISNVLGVEVVTGDGQRRSCTRRQNGDLFDAVLGGVGRCGLITEATLALCPAPQAMRSVAFLYGDATHWLEDQLTATSADIDLHMEGFCWAAAKGMRATSRGPAPFTHWMYGLQFGVNEDPANTSTLANLLASLRADRKVDDHQTDPLSFVHRYEPRFSSMVQSGAWHDPHPWFEAIVPVDRAREFLLRALEHLPAEMGDGHRFMLLDARGAPEFFVGPALRRSALVGFLPMSVARTALPKVMEFVEHLTSLALEVNGRRYLSGWLGRDPAAYFRAHFGDRHERWLATHRRYNPAEIFRSSLFPHW